MGERGRGAATLAQLALLYVLRGRNAGAEDTMRAARALVAADERCADAFVVQRCAAGLRMLDRHSAEAIALATPAPAEAERLADGPAIIENLTTIGAAMLAGGRVDEGVAHLAASTRRRVRSRRCRRGRHCGWR